MPLYCYPAPCAPRYKKPTSADDCLPQARFLVKKKSEHIRLGLGPVKNGDRVIILTLPDQDKYVAEAVTQTLIEEGAQQVDFLYPEDFGKQAVKHSVTDGWKEMEMMDQGIASGALTDVDLMTGLGLGAALDKYLDKHQEYTSAFFDIGGANTKKAMSKDNISRFKGFWPFNNWEEYLSEQWTFPDEVWTEMERQILEPIGKASKVRITDPEGTDLEFSLTIEEAKRWQLCAGLSGHLLMEPLMATVSEVWKIPKVSPEVPPVFNNINGVLAGCANHCGYFPRIELYFQNGLLVEAIGGGKYGDDIRNTMQRYQNLQWPGYPGKGFFWFCDLALCTAVKAFRRKSDRLNSYWIYPNIAERTRAGIIHLGMGVRRHGKEFDKFVIENKLPTGHVHVHNYFPTYEVKLHGTDHWHKIVDKGFITALSNPDLVALTSGYGDPKKLLSYDWIPPLPGINCEGNYLQDYAKDPAAYLKKREDQNKPI